MNRELREVQEVIRSLRVQEDSLRSSREQLQKIEARMRLSLSRDRPSDYVNLEDVRICHTKGCTTTIQGLAEHCESHISAELDRIAARFDARIDYHTIGASSMRKLGIYRQEDNKKET